MSKVIKTLPNRPIAVMDLALTLAAYINPGDATETLYAVRALRDLLVTLHTQKGTLAHRAGRPGEYWGEILRPRPALVIASKLVPEFEWKLEES